MLFTNRKNLKQGYEIYKSGKVKILGYKGNVVTAEIIDDNTTYSITLNLKTKKKSCTCADSLDKRTTCKHVVALYFEIYQEKTKNCYDYYIKPYEEYLDKRHLRLALIDKLSKLDRADLIDLIYSLLEQSNQDTVDELFYKLDNKSNEIEI